MSPGSMLSGQLGHNWKDHSQHARMIDIFFCYSLYRSLRQMAFNFGGGHQD